MPMAFPLQNMVLMMVMEMLVVLLAKVSPPQSGLHNGNDNDNSNTGEKDSPSQMGPDYSRGRKGRAGKYREMRR